ncbi:two-component regulator propeller domain-containing protein [uncultured Formosa sp.]|uniref:hybrid sensor histidine kinase/response regulator transcription factor n=1 Tax=uncultured Formosa sp. TaxID=255435 RepID=UPI00261DB1E6|nr:two-component regulator propeller domain-containing protein [uncultured Formosa sp.]
MKQKILLIIVLSLFFNTLFSQSESSFLHISPKTENGYRTIKNTIQDSLGYIWMSQSNGLMKYDGYDYMFQSVDSIFNKTNIDDEVETINLDLQNNLLVLSKKGLLAKREKNGNYTQLNDRLSKSEAPLLVNKIFVKNSKIWIIDFSNTIHILNDKSFKIEHTQLIPETDLKGSEIIDLTVISQEDIFITTNKGQLFRCYNSEILEIKGDYNNHPGIMYLTLSNTNDLWIGTKYMGLFKYNLLTNKTKHYSYYKDGVDILENDMILTMFKDSDGIIWVGSDGEGLYRIDPVTEHIIRYKHTSLNKSSLSTNSIIHINEDSDKNLWVISNYGDINILVNNTNKIFHHNGLKGNISARVLSLLKDTNNNIWIGTDGKGLTKKNLITGQEKQFLTINNSIEGFYIQTITEDDNNNIWIGTYKNGLWFYNSKQDTVSKISLLHAEGKEPSDVLTTFKDSKGRIWVASDVCLYIFNSKKEKIATFKFGEHNLNGELIRCVVEDASGKIWLGVDNGGLFIFNEETILKNSVFQNIQYGNKKQYNSIVSMAYDGDEKIWLVDLEGQIYFINVNDKSFKKFNDFKTLEGTDFHTVLIEDKNNLWLGSNNGLWNINVKDETSERYTKADGFFSDYYTQRSAFKDKSGMLYFGGLNGVDGFYPNNISKTKIHPQLLINSIEILNKSASIIIPNQIKDGVEKTIDLKLKANQSSFLFKFSAIGNILNNNYLYAYRLRGFNNEWIITKDTRIASYTNIPHGDYTFEVKAATTKGNWDIPIKTIAITIAPPLWMHPLAFLIYTLLLFTVLYGIYKWYYLKKNLILQKVKNEEEANSYYEKMNFFSKMSHEIQTPLTLIMGPAEEIIKKTQNNNDPILNQRLKVIYNNAKRLSRITNTLTTIRNKEIGQLKLKVTENNIIKKLSKISDSFIEEARFKKIDFELENFETEYLLWFDKELVEHIIYNLLSNAFKYTPVEGKITIKTSLDEDAQKLNISIIDSGYGISKKEYNDIFKLFYRSNNTVFSKGMGIGLAFVKELVNLHKAEIHVKSKLKKGTTFTVSFPLNKDAYSASERVELKKTSIKKNIDLSSLNKVEYKSSQNKESILIVEDNYEMLHFLLEVFNENYNVYGAYNGQEGLKMVKDFLPDIIISDITMPNMDGLEMCKILQKDREVSHIPLIFLTAKNPTGYKLKGLKYGAIEFMRKPFDINELQLKVRNILVQNQKIYTKANLKHLSAPEQTIEKSKDDEFIEKLIAILNANLDNPEFKLESLSDSMGMSYSNIYRKCQKLTGKTIVDLLRLLRLKRAAILIIKNKLNVSEACFAVGFNDPRYFSKCFKSQFKLTPSQFKKEAKNIEADTFLERFEL